MNKVTKQQAIHHTRTGVDAFYYQLPHIEKGTTIALAEFTGEHGERKIGKRARLYYILEGKARFLINGEEVEANAEDIIAIPPYATYNLWPIGTKVKVLLIMELFDTTKLPK